MNKFLIVGLGGFIGTISRYYVTVFLAYYFPSFTSGYSTFIVNTTGCFIIGLLLGLDGKLFILTPLMKCFAIIGFLGGFTTFSSYAVYALELLNNETATSAFINIFSQNMIAICSVWFGLNLTKIFFNIII